MSEKLILATDFDGTLNRGGISERDRAAIAGFRKAGNLFGVVTGRDTWMYRTLVDEELEVDFVIVMNGAIIMDGNGKLLAEECSDGCCIRGIADIFGSVGQYLSCVDRTTRYTFHTAYPDGNEKYSPLSQIENIKSFTMLNSVANNSPEAAEIVARINSEYGEYVNALQNGRCIDIPPRGIDKGVGIARYADMMGVPHENIRCAGDEMNDYAMISRFWGCAVSNARAEIKEAAQGVFEGIWEIIEKW